MILGLFFVVVGVLGRLAVLLGIRPGPEDIRLRPRGVFDRAPFTPRSGWLLKEGSGGRESRWLSGSSDRGISDGDGNEGNKVAFRYSFPSGVSRDCICHSCMSGIHMRRIVLTTVAKSPSI